jgi:hypothetical protein
VTTIALLTLAAPAAAQERGVFIDPDSPAGTEYAIPLDQARREAAGGGASPGSPSAGQEPLFGAGIAPRGEERPAGRGDSRSGARRGGADGGDDGDEKPSPSSEASTPRGTTAAVAATAGEGNSDTLLTAGLAGAVLAVGLAAGLAFRRTLGDR